MFVTCHSKKAMNRNCIRAFSVVCALSLAPSGLGPCRFFPACVHVFRTLCGLDLYTNKYF